MAYLALARKWRPKLFSEVVGQQHVVQALQNSILNKKINQAYIFNGTRGVGKTSIARILTKVLNCKNPKNGDPCNECGNFTLVRNGTCLKCNTCGGTSGCS